MALVFPYDVMENRSICNRWSGQDEYCPAWYRSKFAANRHNSRSYRI